MGRVLCVCARVSECVCLCVGAAGGRELGGRGRGGDGVAGKSGFEKLSSTGRTTRKRKPTPCGSRKRTTRQACIDDDDDDDDDDNNDDDEDLSVWYRCLKLLTCLRSSDRKLRTFPNFSVDCLRKRTCASRMVISAPIVFACFMSCD